MSPLVRQPVQGTKETRSGLPIQRLLRSLVRQPIQAAEERGSRARIQSLVRPLVRQPVQESEGSGFYVLQVWHGTAWPRSD
jgi:hypothetical protein